MALPGETREETFDRVLGGLMEYLDDLEPVPSPNESKILQTLRKVIAIMDDETLDDLASMDAIVQVFENVGVFDLRHGPKWE